MEISRDLGQGAYTLELSGQSLWEECMALVKACQVLVMLPPPVDRRKPGRHPVQDSCSSRRLAPTTASKHVWMPSAS